MRQNVLYAEIKESCVSKEMSLKNTSIDDVLFHIIKCELEAANTVVIISPSKQKGIMYKTVPSEQGLVIINKHRIFIKNLAEPWEKITDVTRLCKDTRIIKYDDFALFICEEEWHRNNDSFEKDLCEIIHSSDTLVYCIHDTGDYVWRD